MPGLQVDFAHLILSLLLLALSASPASAEKMRWEGTLLLDLGSYSPMAFAGSGVATINSSSGGAQLQSLRIAGGITGSDTIPITDPYVSVTLRSLRISPQLGTGTLGPFWPVEPWPEAQLSRNTIPVRGSLRMCMLFPRCLSGSRIPLSRYSGIQAVGVGGTMTAGGSGDVRISLEAAPWTVYSTTLLVHTANGGTAAWTRSGWIHGPASHSSSAAKTNGALQLVTPLVVRSNSGMYLPGFASLTLRFVPEPGFLLLIAAGITGLICIHRSTTVRSRTRMQGKLHESRDSRTTHRQRRLHIDTR
ncbi:MAG: hypothetical protein JRG90_17525 [Deltaproteobacteria bacterium]|nr:hypothetical protein [Deltaproteobacteria bacterium]